MWSEKIMDNNNLFFLYKQNLVESIIQYLSEIKSIELRQAMDIYYQSELADEIEKGKYGIENMDYKYLVQDLIENEPQLFCKSIND
jgi:hypothetical protein